MRYFTAFLLFLPSLFAQAPDVQQSLTFTAATAGAPIFVGTGGPNGVVAWRLTYFVDGTSITAAQVAIQGADVPTAAACTPAATFATITTANADLVESANPAVSAAQGNVAVKTYYPCIRANVTAITGAAGTVKTLLQGWKNIFVFPVPVVPGGTQDVNVKQVAGNNVPSAGVNGVLPVGGSVAANGLLSASAYPQLVAGEDYAATPHIQVPKVDSSGRAVVEGDAAQAANLSGNPVPIAGSDYGGTPKAYIPKVDSSGNVSVSAAISGTPDVNVKNVGGTAVPSAGVAGSMPVGGTVANGSNLSAANYPVPMAGSDYGGTPKVYIPKVDSSGNLSVTPAANSTVDVAKVGGTTTVNGGLAGTLGVGGGAAVGSTPTTNPVPQGLLDSAGKVITPDYCTLKAFVSGNTLATGLTTIISASGSTTIRICKISFTTDTLTTLQLVTGTLTKTACDTTPANETGVYSGAGGGLFGLIEDYQSPLITTAGKDLCLGLSAGVTTTGGITILYSQR
jgi:hypothetical protein